MLHISKHTKQEQQVLGLLVKYHTSKLRINPASPLTFPLNKNFSENDQGFLTQFVFSLRD